ncbi:MAG: HAMP domain-containing protein [Ktedonobacteraceae bacterium]|nr:HAMP domain-containing protein [Ktedonobacteraceae bacterium]
MFTFVSNIPIFRRLFYAFLLAAIIPGVIISVLGIVFINTQNTRSQEVQINMNMNKDTLVISSALQRSKDLFNGLNGTQQLNENRQNPAFMHTISGIQQSIEANIKQYAQQYQLATTSQMSDIRSLVLGNNPGTKAVFDQQNALTQIEKLWPACKNAQNQVLKNTDQAVNINVLIQRMNTQCETVQATWARVAQIANQVDIVIEQANPSQTNPLILTTIIAFLAAVLTVGMIGYIVNLTITRPLRQLTALTRRIAEGETQARAEILGHDEIYTVANSMNTMLDNIVRLIQETQSQRDVLQGQVEKLVSEVSGVGEGDLRVQAQVTTDALGVLADSFNYMVEELGSLVIRVKTVAHEVAFSTTAILDRMTQLVERGDIQIKQISGAAVEVERVAMSSQQVAERAQRLYDVARIARQDAQIGRESVQQAIEGMGRINDNVQETASKVQTLGDRSREINEIVDVISSIAHQTNRLALDAAIQAAMAGENGKGFGAVAADIRRLAERAKDQTNKITSIVRGVRSDIGALAVSMQDTERETAAGTTLTHEAGVALESIFAAVEHQAHEIETINQAAVQQLHASRSVVQIMHEISESTQQSSLNTRDASQNMERLTRLVEQLRASVEAFKLRETQDYLASKNNASEDELDNPFTFSNLLRTVSATVQPIRQVQFSGVGAANNFIATPGSPFENYDEAEENTIWEWGTPPPHAAQHWSSFDEEAQNNNWVRK